jgi:undecaprenyl-diphosphatase
MKKIIFLLIVVFYSANIFAQNIDIDVLKNINHNRNDILDIFFNLLSDTVAWMAYGVPICLLTIGFLKKKKTIKVNGLYLGAATLISALISTALKHFVNRVRPFVTYPFIEKLSSGGSPSFPSGHTTDAYAMATAVCFAYPKWYVIAPAYLWASAVGYSRMYLGVHYPSDVLAGVVIGTLTAALCFMAKKAITNKREQKTISDNQL